MGSSLIGQKWGEFLISYEIKSATDFFYDHFYNHNQH